MLITLIIFVFVIAILLTLPLFLYNEKFSDFITSIKSLNEKIKNRKIKKLRKQIEKVEEQNFLLKEKITELEKINENGKDTLNRLNEYKNSLEKAQQDITYLKQQNENLINENNHIKEIYDFYNNLKEGKISTCPRCGNYFFAGTKCSCFIREEEFQNTYDEEKFTFEQNQTVDINVQNEEKTPFRDGVSKGLGTGVGCFIFLVIFIAIIAIIIVANVNSLFN